MTTNGLSLPGPQNITRVELKNGIVVLCYENFTAQSIVVNGLINAGSVFDDDARAGLAVMTAGALMRGTQHRDFNAIHESLENIGADFGISAGAHKASFSGKALAEDLSVLIDILNDVVRYPTFPAQQVERLRGETITRLQYRHNDTRYRADRAFRENLYAPNHPYHRSRSGTLQTVPTLTVDDLQRFHRDHYGPQEMLLVIVGAVKAAEAVEIVRSRLEDWHNSAQQPAPPLPDMQRLTQTVRASITLPGKTQSDIVLGVAGPSRYASDFHAAQLANSILGQFGMMGRIGEIVRDDLGLAYYAYSSVEGGHGPGAWSVMAGVDPRNVELAVEHIKQQLQRLVSEPVSDEDIEDNKSYFTGHLPLQLENNEGLSSVILNMESYGLGLDYIQTYRDRIYRLTKDDLLHAAQNYLNPDALVIAVAGPN
ncbi:MAG: insulinase family protein [Chloroflexi bacterium]|nr:insulinase family protein [Chloroflexota bacterium]